MDHDRVCCSNAHFHVLLYLLSRNGKTILSVASSGESAAHQRQKKEEAQSHDSWSTDLSCQECMIDDGASGGLCFLHCQFVGLRSLVQISI